MRAHSCGQNQEPDEGGEGDKESGEESREGLDVQMVLSYASLKAAFR